MNRAVRFSHIFIWGTFCLVGLLSMATPFLTILFSFLALKHFALLKKKWISVSLFLLLVLAIFDGFVLSLNHAIKALPQIVEQSLPKLKEIADSYRFDLPFSDVDSTKTAAVDALRSELGYLTNFAKIATKEFAFLIIGIVVAISMYVAPKIEMGELQDSIPDNLYTLTTAEIRKRFGTFFKSFETVLGAQLVISAINTFFTSIFVFSAGINYPALVVVITFICGLLPIIGNLISNSIICGIALTESPKLCGISLLFLMALHKLEYFLNSKIIGSRIKNPMWMTLLALVIGEKLAGIPGMIVAPVILHYAKVETSKISVAPSPLIEKAAE